MKIIKINPIRVSQYGEGLVDVTYYKRHGFLWLKKSKVTRRAMSTTGILGQWVDSPTMYLHKLSDIIKGNIPELTKGEIHINSGTTCSNE
jgi:hypothetical protein